MIPPVFARLGSPIFARYLAMRVDGTCERKCTQNDSWVGESDPARKMIRMRVERVVVMRRPCLSFKMASSLLAANSYGEGFAVIAGRLLPSDEEERDIAVVGSHQRSALPPAK